MNKKSDNHAPYVIVFTVIGIGLLFVGLLELSGLMTYRPNRQPLGVTPWLIAGIICLLIAYTNSG